MARAWEERRPCAADGDARLGGLIYEVGELDGSSMRKTLNAFGRKSGARGEDRS